MNQSTKFFSEKQETTISKYLGWNKVAGSGSRACHPADIYNDKWLGECKTHETLTSPIVFIKSQWDKICKEAESQFKYPVLFTDNGTQKTEYTWCMIKMLSCPYYAVKIKSENIRVGKNISFDECVLRKEYQQYLDGQKGSCEIFEINWAGAETEEVGIIPLFQFKEIFA